MAAAAINVKATIVYAMFAMATIAAECDERKDLTCTVGDGPDNDESPLVQLSGGKYVPGSDGTYAQNYQDTWVVAVAQRNGWPTSPEGGEGFFLDLGAYHGTTCSNSALLERSLGWKGVCVEPFPLGFEDRNCVLVSRALSDIADQMVHFSGHGQDRHVRKDQPADAGVDIKTLTIGELLDCVNGTASKYGQAVHDCSGVQGHLRVPEFIHFASLDIEGMEANILRTFPWESVKVGIWIVEQNDALSRPVEKQQATRQILQKQGYLKVPVENPGVDEYYVLPEFWDESLASKAWRVHPDGNAGC